ncbi:MAG: ribosomal protein S18-alanine N-acetyltransferase [Nitrososphaerales archaeon]
MSRRDNTLIVLRRCQPSDLPDILKIERSSFNHPYDRYTFSYFLADQPEGFIISEECGQVCGYIIFTLKRSRGLIVSLAVSQRFRRKGHGRLLLQHALQELRKSTDLVELQVRATDRAAVEFYERHGFRVYSTIRRYYPDGEDALAMKKQI